MKAANVKISLLEKQLYIEKEKMEEFQQEMKELIVSLKKKNLIQEKKLKESSSIVADTLAAFKKLERLCRGVGSTTTATQLVSELKSTMRALTPRLEAEVATTQEHDELLRKEALDMARKKKSRSRRSSTYVPMVVEDQEEEDDHEEEEGDSLGDLPLPRSKSSFGDSPSSNPSLTKSFSAPADGGGDGRSSRRRSNTVEWVQEGRAASTEDIDTLMKEVYVMMCSSSNNADSNAKDSERDVSLESFMTLEEFVKFATLSNMIDTNLTQPRVEALFNATVRASSRGAKKFSKRIQYDDFMHAVEDMADLKYPYGNGAKSAIETLTSDFIWPMRSRLKIKAALSSRRESKFEAEWIRPEVLNFFKAQNTPLTTLFKRYSSMSSSISTQLSTRGAMPVDQFCQFCLDYEITPALLPVKDLMESVRFVIGKKLQIQFSEFIQCLAKLAEDIHGHKDNLTLLQKVEALFHDIDRSGSIFAFSDAVRKREKDRRTSTMGKMQMAGGREKGRRVSQMSQKRLSNVNKAFMMDM